MRTWIIGIIVVVMLGWAFYEAFDTNDQTGGAESNSQESSNGSESANEFELEESEAPVSEKGDWIQTGEKAPDFTLTTLAGDEVTLSEYEGEKVLINFWATWCPPCRAEMPDMQDFYEEHDANILAVNLTETEGGLNSVEAFVDEFDLTFPIVLDKKVEAANDFGVQPIPTSFFIDRKGIVQSISVGPMTYDYMVEEWESLN
ncbi:redoxin domain-containing protein [Alteribacillus iranensis]|uniref:Peroxiredoxin n=1 Tax=Alteribacillus iranensis TaxID=930128 RepID=A0A1I2E2D2_9BACI|nr:redoxin domain-containing protein [Alteribacillus iranensis]SFE87082.1 Peroxiredoxin [Alteribacillus iranensis]